MADTSWHIEHHARSVPIDPAHPDPAAVAFGPNPLLGQQPGQYRGRVIVELWMPPAGATDDGMVMVVTGADDLATTKQFLRDVVGKLQRRLGTAPPVAGPG